MSHRAVAAWIDGLDDALARESGEWLGARQRERGLTFGDRPLCSVIRPRFFSPVEYDGLRHATEALLGAFRTAGEAARRDREFRKQFRLAEWEEELLDRAPALHVDSPLSRLDAFIDPTDGVARITEYNGETPAGTGYTDTLTDLFLGLPAMRRFTEEWVVRPLPGLGHLHNVLLESWHRFRGVRTTPSVAIVDWENLPTQSEFAVCEQYLRSMGVPCRITSPEQLRYTGGILRDHDGTVIDLIYKRVLLHELVAKGGLDHPMLRAVADGAVCMVNPAACKPLHKKASLAVLSDERNADRFSAAEQRAITTHVPWTRVVEERRTLADGVERDLIPWMLSRRETLVLKPNDDYGGAGIVLGWEVDDAAWEQSVARALVEPYIVQRRIALPKEPFPVLHEGGLLVDDRIVDTAPFCWHGAWMDGCLTRISTSALVNVTAGSGSTVPTFVVEPR